MNMSHLRDIISKGDKGGLISGDVIIFVSSFGSLFILIFKALNMITVSFSRRFSNTAALKDNASH